MTNEKIIEELKPFLDQVLAKEDSHINDVRIELSRKDGDYIPTVSAWYEVNRIESDSLENLMLAIENFDPKKKEREKKMQRIAELQAELEQLQ